MPARDIAPCAGSTACVPHLRPSGRGWAALCCILAALAGCGADELSDLQAYVTEVKSRKKGKVEPLPDFKAAEPFVFQATGRRDPFARTEKKEENAERPHAATGPRPDLTRAKEDLESFELDSLRMVGTVKLQGGLWGLVKAADGTIHRVRPGNHMGRNYGRIVQVGPERIELVELVSVSTGGWEERQAALDLNDATATDAGQKTR
ncbi:MAG: pilus assembly protein PilP [Gammaproteobacteria bacterium]|nr:pilus assembly protein PilP [Gammaproteobacteria bacterium]